MLATIIRTDVAVDVSIKIMDAFVEMRKFLMLNGQVFERLTNVEYKLLEHDNKFNQVFNELQNNKGQELKQKIFFNELYHCGASLKDLGKKCFGINKIEGINFIENIKKIINSYSYIIITAHIKTTLRNVE